MGIATTMPPTPAQGSTCQRLARPDLPHPGDMLAETAQTVRSRAKEYGLNQYQHGDVMRALFPHGILLRDAEDHNRFGLLNMIVAKLTRYAHNFHEGGHQDSAHDLSGYGALLEELDNFYKAEAAS
jgi:hypothetical protein